MDSIDVNGLSTFSYDVSSTIVLENEISDTSWNQLWENSRLYFNVNNTDGSENPIDNIYVDLDLVPQ